MNKIEPKLAEALLSLLPVHPSSIEDVRKMLAVYELIGDTTSVSRCRRTILAVADTLSYARLECESFRLELQKIIKGV